MKLIAFDGDHTLWTPLSGVCLSDRTPTDDIGWPHFSYKPIPGDPLIAERDDGARFALRPEARLVFQELHRRGTLVGVVSYNHQANVERVLDSFGLRALVDYVVAEWHTNKDQMLLKMISAAQRAGHNLSAEDVLLVDDDPEGLYKDQCASLGIAFICFGSEISSLNGVLDMSSA